MKIKFWGVRGSVPTPGKSTVKYGGNTACVSVEFDDRDDLLIFDSGTGIRVCGLYLMSLQKPITAHIFISHTHWDHIEGFPFFIPSYIPGNTLHLYGPPSDVNQRTLAQIMDLQTSYEYFPIRISQLGATLNYFDCKEGKFDVSDLEFYACKLNHPVNCFAYKLIYNGKILIYGGDHEKYRNIYRDDPDPESELDEEFLMELDKNTHEQNNKIIQFCKDADVVIWDAQYTDEEYETKKGWGHSTYNMTIDLAAKASIKHLVINHHDPLTNDEKLEKLEEEYKIVAKEKGVKMDFSREEMLIEL